MQHSPKLAILQSLDKMDAVQMGEVLDYIKSILNKADRTVSYQVFKREAMKQIAQALKNNKTGMQAKAA
ncbi:MAG TPA: hypothetical protein VK508_11410 [Cyclobacteriaceae bacterium]|nr:hypothetical protein [Cyclobacteriaceae bacterium]